MWWTIVYLYKMNSGCSQLSRKNQVILYESTQEKHGRLNSAVNISMIKIVSQIESRPYAGLRLSYSEQSLLLKTEWVLMYKEKCPVSTEATTTAAKSDKHLNWKYTWLLDESF